MHSTANYGRPRPAGPSTRRKIRRLSWAKNKIRLASSSARSVEQAGRYGTPLEATEALVAPRRPVCKVKRLETKAKRRSAQESLSDGQGVETVARLVRTGCWEEAGVAYLKLRDNGEEVPSGMENCLIEGGDH